MKSKKNQWLQEVPCVERNRRGSCAQPIQPDLRNFRVRLGPEPSSTPPVYLFAAARAPTGRKAAPTEEHERQRQKKRSRYSARAGSSRRRKWILIRSSVYLADVVLLQRFKPCVVIIDRFLIDRYESRSYSLSPYRRDSRSRSVDSSDVENPGNNLYVTGLSARVTDRDLEEHFSAEGEVIDASIVLDPWTRESRGFGFVTMATVKEADRCIKYLDRSVLEGRVITVEKAKRRRGRTPTPGKYLGTKSSRARRYSPSYSPVQRDSYRSQYSPERERSFSPYGGRRSYSPYDRRRSCSPYERRRSSPYERRQSYSPYGRSPSPYGGRRSYSPYDRRGSRRRSPYHGSRHRSRSPYRYRRERSYSYDRSVSPYYSRRYSPGGRGRSYSCSVSPERSYSRSCSPESQRSGSYSPRKRYSEKKPPRSRSLGKSRSRESYSHSRSSYSRSLSREPSD
uniref:RRM domain-containing protein n=1 Tax=Leersia perrieri TaxID=77586 RepID=A0A0D9VSA0_9ORYZ